MSKYFINDIVEVWENGKKARGTVFSARRTIFWKVKYTVAVIVPAGFDPQGIGRSKYRYPEFYEDDVIGKIGEN